MSRYPERTDDEKRRIVKQIKEMIETYDCSTLRACREVGISKSSYDKWKKELEN